jgi:NAD+-dependent protein deacetylase sirtuin 5
LVLTKRPNPAHKALIAFERRILSQARLHEEAGPPPKTFLLITQNIDGLSQGSHNIIEMHGTLFKTRCTVCGDIRENRDSPITPSLIGTENENFEREIPLDDLPKCKECHGLLRPHVVWFEEALESDVVIKIQEALNNCDVFMMIGTVRKTGIR